MFFFERQQHAAHAFLQQNQICFLMYIAFSMSHDTGQPERNELLQQSQQALLIHLWQKSSNGMLLQPAIATGRNAKWQPRCS